MRALRTMLVTAVALAATAAPATAAVSTGGDPVAPPRSLIAEVQHAVAVHSAPGGRRIARIPRRTPFGSPTRLAVLARRGGWLAVSTERLGNTRRGWIRMSDVRVSATAYRIQISLSSRRLE